jgi:hypothetical protein
MDVLKTPAFCMKARVFVFECAFCMCVSEPNCEYTTLLLTNVTYVQQLQVYTHTHTHTHTHAQADELAALEKKRSQLLDSIRAFNDKEGGECVSICIRICMHVDVCACMKSVAR